MSYESEFNDLLTQSITVRTVASKGTDGSSVYSTASSTFRARVVNDNRQIRDQRGNTVTAQYVVWVASTGTLSAQSKFTLPDGTSPPVLDVAAYPDEDGAHHHHRVTFGF